jgi:hypothetical protein
MIAMKSRELDASFRSAVDLYRMQFSNVRLTKERNSDVRGKLERYTGYQTQLMKSRRRDASCQRVVERYIQLLSSSPHSLGVHPWLHVVLVRLRTLWASDVGVGIIQVANTRSIRVRIRVYIAVALRGR